MRLTHFSTVFDLAFYGTGVISLHENGDETRELGFHTSNIPEKERGMPSRLQ